MLFFLLFFLFLSSSSSSSLFIITFFCSILDFLLFLLPFVIIPNFPLLSLFEFALSPPPPFDEMAKTTTITARKHLRRNQLDLFACACFSLFLSFKFFGGDSGGGGGSVEDEEDSQLPLVKQNPKLISATMSSQESSATC